MKRMRNQMGFTLSETLLTVAIFVVLMGACTSVLISGSHFWSAGTVEVELEQNLRKSVEWIKQDLVQTGTSTITNVPADGNWYTSITFKVCSGVSNGSISWSGSTTTFALGGTGGNKLQRTVGATVTTLADNIQTLQFRRTATDPGVIEVSMQAQKNTSQRKSIAINRTFKVTVRN